MLLIGFAGGLRRSEPCLPLLPILPFELSRAEIATRLETWSPLTMREVFALTGLHTWLVHSRGESFTAADFGNSFRDRCDEAGLPERTAHGIRKIAAETAAGNGAKEKQMMDILGWTKADLAAY